MRYLYSLFAVACLMMISACDKGDDQPDPDQPPATSGKKLYLTKLHNISLDSDPSGYYQYDYDDQHRLIKISGAAEGKPAVVFTTFSYDSQGRLAESVDYGVYYDPLAVNHIRRYYYNAAGQCIGDTAFSPTLQIQPSYSTSYTYDNEGRLLTRLNGIESRWRFEYGTGKNPVKFYLRYSNQPELEYAVFKKYDDKKPWIGESQTLRLYYRAQGFQYMMDFYGNNPTEYEEVRYYYQTSTIQERYTSKEVLEYNADGYPVKREVTETNIGGNFVRLKQTFEYKE